MAIIACFYVFFYRVFTERLFFFFFVQTVERSYYVLMPSVNFNNLIVQMVQFQADKSNSVMLKLSTTAYQYLSSYSKKII